MGFFKIIFFCVFLFACEDFGEVFQKENKTQKSLKFINHYTPLDYFSLTCVSNFALPGNCDIFLLSNQVKYLFAF